MITFITGAIVGSIILGLVLRNNPKLTNKLLKVTDKIEGVIDSKLGKE